MRRKKQFLAAARCALSMMIDSVAVVAQSRDKKQEPKSGVQQEPEGPSNNLFFLPPEPTLHTAYAAPQIKFTHLSDPRSTHNNALQVADGPLRMPSAPERRHRTAENGVRSCQ